MKISKVYKVICCVMHKIENIDFIDVNDRRQKQRILNEAYTILDNFKDEIIRENIKNKMEGTNDE